MKKFVNLTNGIEILDSPAVRNLNTQFDFIRIQSTACEQKRWDFLLQDLDYNFLLWLAQGKRCIVYDYSSKKAVTRACYQGIEFIKFVLNKRWLNKDYIPIVRSNNVFKYFDEVYRKLEDRTFKKLDYFKKFLNTEKIHLSFECKRTTYDGNYEWYSEKLRRWINQERSRRKCLISKL